MLEILTPIWQVKAETARAVRQRIRSVLEWAIAMDNGSYGVRCRLTSETGRRPMRGNA